MFLGKLFAATDIAASGLSAERLRMEIAAKNIAHANATRGPGGEPYRRQQVVFATQAESLLSPSAVSGEPPTLGGVRVAGIEGDQTPFPTIYHPGHPDADSDGYLRMPNVVLPLEMVDMMTASRSYEANLKSLETFRKMTEQTLSLMRGSGT